MHEKKSQDVSDRKGVLAALRELIQALDRRLPHVERVGEMRIAREAAVLRKQAATRIEQLATASSDRRTREAELSDAVMADDGWPLHSG